MCLCTFKVSLSEVRESHWFDGVLSAKIVQDFLAQILHDPVQPSLPKDFELVTVNPASTTSRGGIQILQLLETGRLASIRVKRQRNHWNLITQNVRRFRLVRDIGVDRIEIDGVVFATTPSQSFLYITHTWQSCTIDNWMLSEKSPHTYGPVRQIFMKPIHIILPSNPIATTSDKYIYYGVQLANLWHLYSRGYCTIVYDKEVIGAKEYLLGNYIVLGGSNENDVAASLTILNREGTVYLAFAKPTHALTQNKVF